MIHVPVRGRALLDELFLVWALRVDSWSLSQLGWGGSGEVECGTEQGAENTNGQLEGEIQLAVTLRCISQARPKMSSRLKSSSSFCCGRQEATYVVGADLASEDGVVGNHLSVWGGFGK